MRHEVKQVLVSFAVYSTLVASAFSQAACSRHKSGASDDTNDMGTHASMVSDKDGTVYVSYYWRTHRVTATRDEKVGALMFTKGKLGTDGFVRFEDPQVVDGDVRIAGNADVGLYTSLKLGSDGLARISYYDKQNGDLKFATQVGGNKWTIETVDAPGNVGGHSSLVLENDLPRISYYDFDAKVLKLAAKMGTAWTKSVIDDGNAGLWDVGRWSSLASDGNGGLGVAYYDATNGDLGYRAGNVTAFGDAEWVDEEGDTGRWPSLGFDLGKPRLAYQDYTNQHLKFAKKDAAAGTWAVETVDSAPWVGADIGMAIDATGKITLGYFDGLNNDVLSASWDGQAWTLGHVAQTGANGYFNNVALDPASKPIFGYYTYTGTTFIAQTIGAGAPAGGS